MRHILKTSHLIGEPKILTVEDEANVCTVIITTLKRRAIL